MEKKISPSLKQKKRAERNNKNKTKKKKNKNEQRDRRILARDVSLSLIDSGDNGGPVSGG